MSKYIDNIEHSGRPLWFAARASAFAALCAFGMQPFVASAQIAVDASAATRPTLGTSGNGTQLVNIVAPNAAGVSNNRFTQYNVGTGGVILNNATQNVQTQTGGAVQANAALGGRNANVVLMQVTGGQASQLLGMTEVAGKGANVVLANPAGITCSGCGFLNAPRVTLATGTPTLNADGSLGAIDVKQGTIAVQGKGLNASSSAVDLIARAITVNAEVRGQSIDAIAGANRVDYASKNATAQQGVGATPQVAIDVQSLGSMYGGGSVRLVGTEAGVGVRDNGAITSLTGNLSIASNGDVVIGAPARINAGGVDIRGVDVRNDGATAAQGMSVVGRNSLTQGGTIDAAHEVTLSGDQLTLASGSIKGNSVTLQGDKVTNQGATLNAAQQLTVFGTRVTNAGTLSSGGDLSIGAMDTFTNSKGAVLAQNNVQLNAGTLDNRNGKIDAAHGGVYAQAQRIANANGSIRGNGALSLDVQNLDNAAGTLATAGNATIDAASGSIDNTNGVIDIGNSASVHAGGKFLNTHGSLKAGDLASLDAATIDNRDGVISTTRGSARLASGEILNRNGRIASADRLSVNALTLDNTTGTIAAQSVSTIDVDGKLTNDGGSIVSQAFVSGSAGSLSNVGGTISGDIRARSGNGGVQPPQPVPQPDPNASGFDPGPAYVRVSAQDFDPNKPQYQSGFYGPDGYYYAYVGSNLQAAH